MWNRPLLFTPRAYVINGRPLQPRCAAAAVQVAEGLVGAVIGHGGKAIVEIQKMTGASVKISNKGVFAPGTHNRVITVKGPAGAVSRAVAHVRKCIDQEEDKRSRQEQMIRA